MLYHDVISSSGKNDEIDNVKIDTDTSVNDSRCHDHNFYGIII